MGTQIVTGLIYLNAGTLSKFDFCGLGYNSEAAPRHGAAFLFMLFARQGGLSRTLGALRFFMFPSTNAELAS